MTRVAGVILAGGAGTRIGGDKALIPFQAGTLIDSVMARVEPQLSALAISIAAKSLPAYRTRLPSRYPLLTDSLPEGTGPLAGIVAALEWAGTLGNVPWLATFPCDTPFLPTNLVSQLLARADDAPVAARADERLHGVCALWPVGCASKLRDAVEQDDVRSLKRALDLLGGATCDIAGESDAFLNVNTADDLARAEAMVSRRNR